MSDIDAGGLVEVQPEAAGRRWPSFSVFPSRKTDPAAEALKREAREVAEARRRETREIARVARASRRLSRAQARTRWAQQALAVPIVMWMEGVLWFCTAASLTVAYALSYSHQSEVFSQLGYDGWEHQAAPFMLDLPLTASIAGLFLSARWKSPWWRKWTYRGMTIITAPLSLGANALHRAVTNGVVDWSTVLSPVRLVASLVPAIIVVTVVISAEVTFAEHGRLAELGSRDNEEGNVPFAGESDESIDPVESGNSEEEVAKTRKQRPRQRTSPAKGRSGGRGRKPTVDRVVEVINELAAATGVAQEEVSQADINEHLGFRRDLSTHREIYRAAFAQLAEKEVAA